MRNQILVEMKLREETKELKKGPEIDNLSKQIVQMMDERKGETTNDRLYKYGKEKIRDITIKQLTLQSHSTKDLHERVSQKPPHRGRPTQDALYDLHQQLKEKKEAITEQENQKALIMAKKNFQIPKSENLIIQGFKKEFRTELGKLLQKNGKAPCVTVSEGEFNKILPYYPNPRDV